MSIQVSFLVLPYNLASISEVDKIKYLQSSFYFVYNKSNNSIVKHNIKLCRTYNNRRSTSESIRQYATYTNEISKL